MYAKIRLFCRRCDIRHRKIPVGQQNLEPPLFLAIVGILVWPELPDQAFFVRISSCCDG